MLIGRFYHALEQKRRLSIPKVLRQHLSPIVVLTAGLEGCLYLYPQTVWQKLISATAALPQTQKKSRDWLRYLTHNANFLTIDKLGRILIPEDLFLRAKLSQNVVIVGTYNRLEIWDRDQYHAYFEAMSNQIETTAETIPILVNNKT